MFYLFHGRTFLPVVEPASGLLVGKLTGESALDRAWSAATLYKDPRNPILEEFDLTGRAQFDYFNVDSNRGDNDFFEIRRLRMGVDTFWFNRHIELKATLDTALRSYNADEVFYNRMTEMYVNFHFNDALNLRAGKFEPHFGYDREFSDNTQKFFERSFFDDQVFNNSGNDYVTGVSMNNAAAAYFDYQNGSFGLVTQLGYGNGINTKGDIYELMIMPTYLITKQLEVVLRYQLGLASRDNGITTLNRQEKTIGKFTGDTDNLVYLGLNYYIYGQKLKLMAGEQYDNLSGGSGAKAGFEGWTSLVGLRMFF